MPLKFDTLSRRLVLRLKPFFKIRFHKTYRLNGNKTKNKKKENKGKFRVYNKKSSSLRFRIKSPPLHFQKTFIFLSIFNHVSG